MFAFCSRLGRAAYWERSPSLQESILFKTDDLGMRSKIQQKAPRYVQSRCGTVTTIENLIHPAEVESTASCPAKAGRILPSFPFSFLSSSLPHPLHLFVPCSPKSPIWSKARYTCVQVGSLVWDAGTFSIAAIEELGKKRLIWVYSWGYSLLWWGSHPTVERSGEGWSHYRAVMKQRVRNVGFQLPIKCAAHI